MHTPPVTPRKSAVSEVPELTGPPFGGPGAGADDTAGDWGEVVTR